MTARLPYLGVEFRWRIPVTRVGLLSRTGGFQGWIQPPLEGLDLAEVGLEDRLRVELHEPPVLDNGRLISRLVGFGEVVAGRPIDSSIAFHFFEIELHRWRDSLGLSAGGIIQVRGSTRWIDIVRLCGVSKGIERPIQPPPPDKRSRLVAALDAALKGSDRSESLQKAKACLDWAGRNGASAAEAELLKVTAARAYFALAETLREVEHAVGILADLGDRPDLPEVSILRTSAALRLGGREDKVYGPASDMVHRLKKELPDLPQKHLLLGEYYYHLARRVRGSGRASWGSCLSHAKAAMNSEPLLRLNRPERSTAQMLWTLARLMLGYEVEGRGAMRVEDPQAEDDLRESSWLKGLRFLAGYVREPWLRVLAATRAPTLIEPAPLVLRRAEENLIRIATLQAQGDDVPAGLWAPLAGWQSDEFFAIGLLRARQARLEGRTEGARREYCELWERARDRGPDFLLDVIVAERSIHDPPQPPRGNRQACPARETGDPTNDAR